MALKVSGYASSSGLKNKIVYQSTVTATTDVDVLGTGAYTAGATFPDYQFRIPANTAKRFDFTDGIRFDQLTFWCNDGPQHTDTDNPGGTVLATFVIK